MASILYDKNGNEIRIEAEQVQAHFEAGYTAEPPAEKAKRGRPAKSESTGNE